MLTKQEAEALKERTLAFSKLPECEIRIDHTETVFIRFANNGITTSGYQLNREISITSITSDGRTGNVLVSEFSDEALRNGVQLSEDLARISKPDPEHVSPLGPQQFPTLNNFDSFTAGARSPVMIPHVKAIIDSAKSKNLTAAGFITRTVSASSVANKAGLFGFHTSSDSSLSSTMRNADGSSSGWASQASSSIKDLDGSSVADISRDKCLNGLNKKKLDPGKYTVILEPAAVSDIIGIFGFGLDARSAEQGQSFLSKKGKAGETLLGEKLFPDYITLRSDPSNTKISTTPWEQSLLPNEKVTWIDRGLVKNMYYDRYWAQKANKKPTPYPGNLTLDGQNNSLDDLIKSADKALLVTRLWYIRVLQQQTLQVTGLTRDGLFLVENGKIAAPVMNFRWNDSPVRVLQNAKKLTMPKVVVGSETGSSFAPAILATDFNFASVSDAV